jgi:hypothetical protein
VDALQLVAVADLDSFGQIISVTVRDELHTLCPITRRHIATKQRLWRFEQHVEVVVSWEIHDAAIRP